jgi:Chaperone of endosialidase
MPSSGVTRESFWRYNGVTNTNFYFGTFMHKLHTIRVKKYLALPLIQARSVSLSTCFLIAVSGGSSSAVIAAGVSPESNRADVLLAVDLNRSTVIAGVISKFSSELSPEESKALEKWLNVSRADQLLLLSTMSNVDLALSLVEAQTRSPLRNPDSKVSINSVLDQSKAIGEPDRDLVYTPITPCRVFDTRSSAAGALQATGLLTGVTQGFDMDGANLSAQGGSSAGCGIPQEARSVVIAISPILPPTTGWIVGAANDGLPYPAATITNYTVDLRLSTTTVILPMTGQSGADIRLEARGVAPYSMHAVGDVTGYFMAPTRAGNGLRVIQTTGSLPNAPITINGSLSNIATAQGATVLGGGYTGSLCQDAGGANYGCENQATGVLSTVGGGFSNRATEFATTVMGGQANTASENSASILGGQRNTALGANSVIVGGFLNRTTATGIRSVVVGGQQNEAGGDGSFAGGTRAVAAHNGAFVWSGFNTSFPFTSIVANEFAVRAVGGARFVTAIDLSGNPSAAAILAAGSGSWTSLSDKNAKTAISAVKPQDILSKVLALPVSTWQYKSQDKSIRHIGPMSQDFKKAFGVGETDKGITTVDADGVALAAIQGLNEKLVNALKDSKIAPKVFNLRRNFLRKPLCILEVVRESLARTKMRQ